MTEKQKGIIEKLFLGYNIAAYREGGARLRDENNNVIAKINAPTYRTLRKFLRMDKRGLYVLDKREMRKMPGQSWIKQFYILQTKSK